MFLPNECPGVCCHGPGHSYRWKNRVGRNKKQQNCKGFFIVLLYFEGIFRWNISLSANFLFLKSDKNYLGPIDMTVIFEHVCVKTNQRQHPIDCLHIYLHHHREACISQQPSTILINFTKIEHEGQIIFWQTERLKNKPQQKVKPKRVSKVWKSIPTFCTSFQW